MTGRHPSPNPGLSTEWLQQAIYPEPVASVGITSAADEQASPVITRYWCPEAEAVRYKQSHACRIRWQHTTPSAVHRPSAAGAPGQAIPAPTSAFFKRIVMRELPMAVKKLTVAPYKLGGYM